MSQLTSLISKLDLHVSGTIDWSYLTQAHCTLLECRRILSNAYVFCFFMFEPANFEQVCSHFFALVIACPSCQAFGGSEDG